MTFDRKEYQREYMKEYMRKRRGGPAECQECGIFKQYCDGKYKIGKCPMDSPLYEQSALKKSVELSEYLDGRLAISHDIYKMLIKRKMAPDEDMDLVIFRILNGDVWERDENGRYVITYSGAKIIVKPETLARLQRLRLNDKESMDKMLNRILDEQKIN